MLLLGGSSYLVSLKETPVNHLNRPATENQMTLLIRLGKPFAKGTSTDRNKKLCILWKYKVGNLCFELKSHLDRGVLKSQNGTTLIKAHSCGGEAGVGRHFRVVDTPRNRSILAKHGAVSSWNPQGFKG